MGGTYRLTPSAALVLVVPCTVQVTYFPAEVMLYPSAVGCLKGDLAYLWATTVVCGKRPRVRLQISPAEPWER